jgi:predicted small lipoprotein YifL
MQISRIMEKIMKSIKKIMLVVLMFALLAACTQKQPSVPQAAVAPVEQATATLDLAATENAKATEEAQNKLATQNAQATQDAEATASLVAATSAAATAKAESLNATRTVMASKKSTATAAVQATATAYAQSFMEVIQGLYDDGKIATTEGELIRLEDFERSEAQINYFFPEPLNYTANNFVFSSKLSYAIDGKSPNWFSSGCGFMYGLQETGGQGVFVYVGGDGFLHALEGYKSSWPRVLMKKWGKGSEFKGEADLMIVQSNLTSYAYVNGKLVGEFYTRFYKPGDLGQTMISGSNKGFGVRCSWTDSNLYLLEDTK